MDRMWINARLATMVGEGLGVIDDGVVACRDGRIAYAGPRCEAPEHAAEIIDCGGRWVTPGLIDCHTHLIHGGDRAGEWAMRLDGAATKILPVLGVASFPPCARLAPPTRLN